MIAEYGAADFVSDFWHYFVVALSIGGILFTLFVLRSQTTKKLAPGEQAEVMAPTWDGDLQELNNPLPRWWMWMFYGLTFFSIIYLILYPGLGKFEGIWNWTSAGAYHAEKTQIDGKFNAIMAPFMQQDVMALAANPEAKKMGENLYMTYCSQCHGGDAQGSRDFPNLTDNLWLFGGTPDDIKSSIAGGRLAEMPGGLAGDEQGAKEVANYVLALGGKAHNADLATAGKDKFAACAGCHGEDGKGIPAAGFPNIVDAAWQYGGTEAAITESIIKGRKGGMPAQQAALGDAKIHLLTAYVWGLGGGQKPVAEAPPAEPMAAPAAEPAATVGQ